MASPNVAKFIVFLLNLHYRVQCLMIYMTIYSDCNMKPSGTEEEWVSHGRKKRCSDHHLDQKMVVSWMLVKQGSTRRRGRPLLHMGINWRVHAPYVCHTLRKEENVFGWFGSLPLSDSCRDEHNFVCTTVTVSLVWLLCTHPKRSFVHWK